MSLSKKRNKERMQESRVQPKTEVVQPKVLREGNHEVVVDSVRAGKLLLICKELDHTIHGLGGEVNMLDLVRYGTSGPTMRGVKASLGE